MLIAIEEHIDTQPIMYTTHMTHETHETHETHGDRLSAHEPGCVWDWCS